jgi:O-antigen ligase
MEVTVAGAGAPGRFVHSLRLLRDLGLYGYALSLGCGLAPIEISLGLVGIAALGLHLAGERVLRPTVLDKPIAFYLLAVLLGAVAARGEGASFFAPDVLGVWRVGAAILLAGAIGGGRKALRLGVVFLVAAAIQGGYGGLLWAGIEGLRWPGSAALAGGQGPGAAGTYGNPATFAYVAGAALLLLAAAAIAGAIRGRSKWLAGAAAVVIGLGAVFAGVPAVWPGFFAGVLAVAVVGRLYRRSLPVALGALLFVGAASLATDAVRGEAGDLEDAGDGGVGVPWARSMTLLEDHPVTGIGAGTFSRRLPDGAGAVAADGHSRNNLLFAWVESGPLGLLALLWCFGAVLAALRRGTKDRADDPPGVRAAILAGAAVIAATLAWSFTRDPLYDGVAASTLAFFVALGLAASGPAAEPLPEDTLLGTSAREGLADDGVPAPGTSAAVAAVAVAAAALGGLGDLGAVGPGLGLAAAILLVLLAAGYLPGLPGRVGPVLRGLAVLAGAVILASRAFVPKLLPGTAEWWTTPGAGVAVLALVGGLAGTAWAIRRPGQVGSAPVAGAAAFAFVAGWIGLDHHLLFDWLRVPAGTIPGSYNFAVAAGVASLLFVAWTGPLGWGEVEARGWARRLVGLPQVAVALGLAVVAAAGLF